MSQEEKVDAKATLKTEISNNKKNDKQELELDELVGKLSIEGTPQVSQKLSKEEKHGLINLKLTRVLSLSVTSLRMSPQSK